jgi:hypothetical protein
VLLDHKVHRHVDEAHAGVAQPLSEHRDELDNLAHVTAPGGTPGAPDAYAAAGIPMPRTNSSRLTGAGY